MADWMMNAEIHADDYEEMMDLLMEEEDEEEDPFDPFGEDPVDLFGPWWE